MAGGQGDRPRIEAAGGVVLRPGPAGTTQVLVVHREHYRDWSLPKGKLERGESAKDAARREVLEETGVRCRVGRRLPSTHYEHQGRPKRVRWWAMSVLEDHGHTPDEEVREVRWVDVAVAGDLLTYATDRSTLDAALAED